MTKAQNRKIAVLRWLEKIRVSESHRFAGSPCWEWIACRDKVSSYGRFFYDGKKGYAHRFAYEYFISPIASNHEIDHMCRVPYCCNPMHLEQVTVRENRRRRNLHRTHCKRGHALSVQNEKLVKRNKRTDLYWLQGHERLCLQCYNMREAKRYNNRKMNTTTGGTQ